MTNRNYSINPIFIGHGSPMNAIASNRYSQFLSSYSKSLPKPDALVVISAHWQTEGTYITGSDNPKQIYDFYGFPDELYKVQYAPPGSKHTAELISSEMTNVQIDFNRGIDHAGWAVAKHMFPEQDVPLLELSLDIHKNPEQHFLLGRRLGLLRNNGILFIGSGNMVHNLGEITFNENEEAFSWAVEADDWLKGKINHNEVEEIVHYEKNFPDYKRSIPTNEHFLPLLYILGMHNKTQKIRTIFEEIQNGSISMRSIEVQ